MDTAIQILAGFGLAGAAGLNAWLPLLIVGLAARFTAWIVLPAPYNLLSEPLVLVILAILLGIEVFADKIPAIDTLNDVIQTVIRPTAGAILFAANAGAVSDMNPTLALVLGLLTAGSVHAVKATTRPLITATTGGVLNPLVSLLEDLMAAVVTILALIAPLLAIIVFVLFAFGIWRLVRGFRRRLAPRPS